MSKPIKLDVKDKKLLSCLLNNSRTPATQIAKNVMLSRDAIAYRTNRLEEQGIILQYFPRLNYKTLGLYRYVLFFLIDERKTETRDAFVEYLRTRDQTIKVTEYSDRWDFEVNIYARNIDDVNKYLDKLRNKFASLILDNAFYVAIRHYVNREIPQALLPTEFEPYDKATEVCELDAKDKQILGELSKDCTQTTYALGAAVGLSSDAIIYRMKKYIEKKIIRNYSANIDFTRLNLSQYTFGIRFRHFGNKEKHRFEEFVITHPHIIQTMKTFGDFDMLVYIAVENHEDFHKTLQEIKAAFSESIISYDVFVMYKQHYFNPFPKICLQV